MIYFDKNKQAYADKIENPICTITDLKWLNYAGTDKWDMELFTMQVQMILKDMVNML